MKWFLLLIDKNNRTNSEYLTAHQNFMQRVKTKSNEQWKLIDYFISKTVLTQSNILLIKPYNYGKNQKKPNESVQRNRIRN